MATTSNKLGLKIPSYTDEVEATINDLANNFQTLDDSSEEYASKPPTEGLYQAGERFWNNYSLTQTHAGWSNIRTGTSAPIWGPSKVYVVGQKVVPERDNGHFYECIQAGNSGVTEPIFPVSTNGQVQDIRGSNTWIASHQYKVNDIALPSIDNGRFYLCVQAGESNASEPVWSLVDGNTTYDKNAAWRSYRIAKWKESGPAALFKAFGKFD
ncbi:hypothetical protein [Paenibacillus donghaensis]|uniref:Uncharacterized protein n=1 Tax=Paenibacillus donghaensis TaxID=414771 RepID=A0A2Z2KB73_9BACL|nr:hypothetical protein [Paenibacillus donghaensis]ASA22777.1 hypothetical protein B9T62_19410 [Paenibacillus donghaensis]